MKKDWLSREYMTGRIGHQDTVEMTGKKGKIPHCSVLKIMKIHLNLQNMLTKSILIEKFIRKP